MSVSKSLIGFVDPKNSDSELSFQINPGQVASFLSPFSRQRHFAACVPGSNIVFGAYRIFEGFTSNGTDYGITEPDHLRFRVTQVLVGLAEVFMLGWVVHSLTSVYFTIGSVTSSQSLPSPPSFSPDVHLQDSCDQEFLGTFPAPLPEGYDYYFYSSSTRLCANFDGNIFKNWRQNKSNPIIIGVIPLKENMNLEVQDLKSRTTENLFSGHDGINYIEGEPLPLLVLYAKPENRCLNAPEVVDINKSLIEGLQQELTSSII